MIIRLLRVLVGIALIVPVACRESVPGGGPGFESESEAESEAEGESEAESEGESEPATVCGDDVCDPGEFCFDCDDCDCGDINCNEVLSCAEDCGAGDEKCDKACVELGCAEAQMTYFEMTACWDAATAPGAPCESVCPDEPTCDQCLVLECGTQFDACLSQDCPPPV